MIKISHLADFEQIIIKISHQQNSLGRNRIPKVFFLYFFFFNLYKNEWKEHKF